MSITEIFEKIQSDILDPMIAMLFALATALLLWGVILYVIGSQGDQKKLDQGKQLMLWGIIGMTVMASAWGIVNILCDFLGCVSAP